ncbi:MULTISPECIES: YcbX family protein [Vibrio]|uniref:YcbX family protein n=1 Tax=Vibrio TaxID=662 RepID=UPI00097F404B|nr:MULTISPECIES: YcbX family protein [Vibrio]SJN30396.1 Flavodoxin reductases (ferredoxin-NADPH reductases) family 1 [Vibrio casei]
MSQSELEKKLAKIEATLGLDPFQEATLAQINVYPVKSITGIEMSSSWVEKQGLSFDRRFMVADMNGRMVTARENHQMVRIKAALQANGLVLTYPESKPIHLRFEDFEREEVGCQVWNDHFQSYSTTEQANQWFSFILGKKVQLLFSGEQSNRQREKIQTNVSFADGYPLLLISQGSLDELNRRSTKQNVMAQFRPNIVVSDTEAFAEDSWKRFRIGEVEFEVVKPCMRCVLTTVNPITAMRSEQNEPLNTLSKFRADKSGGIFFGQNVIAKNEGMIRSGDVVEILETKEKEYYADTSQDVVQVDPVKKITISIDGNLFEGDNQSTLLEQAEKSGIPVANSCRSGFCGTCKMTLESGKVEQPDMPALFPGEIDEGKVLACCCVPKSDVELVS